MGLEKVGTTIGKEIIAWARTSNSKSLLTTRPVKVNIAELKFAPELERDAFLSTTLNNRSPNLILVKQLENEALDIPKELKFWDVLNKIKLKPKISKVLSKDFANKKQELLNNLKQREHTQFYEEINLAQNADELAAILERHQTKLLMQGGILKKKIIETTDNTNVEKLRELYLKYYYEFTECAIKIQKSLASNSTSTKAIQIEKQLKSYGIDFVAIDNDLCQGKRLLKACKTWQKSGNKMPSGIIVTDTLPMSLASGQCLRNSAGETIILLRPSSNKLMSLGELIDRLQFKFINWFKPKNKIPPKSTDSKIHTHIHEFAHSVQSQSIVEQRFELPVQYRATAKNISGYANGSIEELYAELKAMSVLTPQKMTKGQWELLEYMEKVL